MPKDELKMISWNQASQLGLIEEINTKLLHPRGLAITRNLETGKSDGLLVADDGFFEYKDASVPLIEDEFEAKLKEMTNA